MISKFVFLDFWIGISDKTSKFERILQKFKNTSPNGPCNASKYSKCKSSDVDD